MPKSYTELYFPVLVQAVLAMALAAGLLTASYLLGKRVRNRVKDMPYESGIVPTGDARQRFSVKFYLVAHAVHPVRHRSHFSVSLGGGLPRTEDVRLSSRCWFLWF